MTPEICLAGAACGALREALYCQLELDTELLAAALQRRKREATPHACEACAQLTLTARMLSRAGWTQPQVTVRLLDAGELRQARRALQRLLEVELTIAEAAREQGDRRGLAAAQERCEPISDTLAALEAAAAAGEASAPTLDGCGR